MEETPPTTVELAPAAPAGAGARRRRGADTLRGARPTTTPERPVGEEELDDDASALPDVHVLRPIAFPVLGPVRYSNDWGNCRDGCVRHHQGTDVIGVRMQPLLAAMDGTVTRIRYENVGKAGSIVTIKDAEGWSYNYFHVNNDTPGSDNGAAGPEWQVVPDLSVGSTVRAGQVVAYMGDSGNAEGSVPHLHFEIRQPGGTPVNPYPSLVAAQERPSCPATAGVLTAPDAAGALSPAAVAVIPLDGGGRWLIDRDGRIFAEGSAAGPSRDCEVVEPATATATAAHAVEPATEPATPVDAATPATAPAAPAEPVAPAGDITPVDREWTVGSGQSLWQIVQDVYGVSDVRTTVALVAHVFAANGDQLSDPDQLNVGITLRLPSRDHAA